MSTSPSVSPQSSVSVSPQSSTMSGNRSTSNIARPKPRVYVAGPLFNDGERWELQNIATLLEAEGYTTFLPHRDGMLVGEVTPLVVKAGCAPEVASKIVRQAIFDLDVFEVIEGCDAMVFSLNGRVPDEGAAAEAGLAYGLGKPIVLFKKDWRSILFGHDNPLISGLNSGAPTVGEMKEISAALDVAIQEQEKNLEEEGARNPYLAPNVRSAVANGRILTPTIRTRNNNAIAAALVQQYAPK